jgi:hypothetical protein
MDAFAQSPISAPAPGSLPKPRHTDPSEGNPSPATIPSTISPAQHNVGTSQDGGDADHSRRKSIDLLEQLTRTAPISHQTISNELSNASAPMMGFGSPSQVPPPPNAGFRPPQHAPTPPQSFQQRDQSPALMGQTPPSTSPGIGLSGAVVAAQNNNQARASPTFKGRMGGNGTKKDWKKAGANDFLKSRSPAGPQSFTLDLSLPLAATSASNDRLHITPIALLKLESIYVPGCTIGVSHWIAYAMTKGKHRHFLSFGFPLISV